MITISFYNNKEHKISTCCYNVYIIFTAPDIVGPFGFYQMLEFSDYQPPFQLFNPIRMMVITGTNTVLCYNLTIYDDDRVEEDEFFSLTLTVQDGSAMTTVVDPQLSSAVFRIVDDGE